MARRKEAHSGGHGWFVTFADLMGLLVAFFVMLVAFSTQDQAKLQVVAGSMRDAFGVQDRVRYSGIIEVLGLPTRSKLKNAAHIDPSEASATPSPDEHDKDSAYGARFKEDRKFALASASLRQALQEMPEITEISKHIMVEETKQGLNIEIVDQDGRSMFPDGAKEPFERTRKLIQKIAPSLKAIAIDILKRLIQGGSQTHRSVGDKAGDAVVAGAVDHATRNDQPVAASGLRGKRGADGFGAAAVLSVFPVCAARRYALSARGGRAAGPFRQAVGSGD
jgi:flagellar motor protein MotB